MRAVGPAHYGPGVYGQGTNATGGLGRRGRELLAEMDRLGMILDVTHLCDDSFWEALSVFKGPVWASHSNCRALVPHNRQLSDDQIEALVERDAVIGAVFDAWMVVPNWLRGETTPAGAGLKIEHIIADIEHICQLAGDARHVGIGLDLDGRSAANKRPRTSLDCRLAAAGPAPRRARLHTENVDAVMRGNFLRVLRRALPA